MVHAMPERFNAYRIHQRGEGVDARFEPLTLDDLSPGEVVIRVAYSSINYKDALAATGAGRILRRYPLVGGIDLAGTVEQSADPAFAAGAAVLVTGCGLSETRDGGYAQFARVPASAVVAMPPGLDAFSAMALGTAGFAAGRAVMRMEINGQTPAMGPVVVTGATGGVGSLAIDMLSAKGYEVVALTGKPESEQYLRALGASQLLPRTAVTPAKQPLESARWGGAIDNCGGDTLAWLLRSTRDAGNVASIGLAADGELHTTVMPFILRGVSLLGVNSSAATREVRDAVWRRLSSDLKPRHLDRIVTRNIEFNELPAAFESYLTSSVVGRTVVRFGPTAA
jgi:acrylyl-CoA reductase (NADPH)